MMFEYIWVIPLLFILVNGQTEETNKIDLGAYVYPTYFWPFDYSTKSDIIGNQPPLIYGSKDFNITGVGKGYLKIPIEKSSAQLMNKNICEIDNCKKGLTIALWVKLVNSKIKLDDVMKDQKISVLSTKEFQLNFVARNGDFYISIHSKGYLAEMKMNTHEWYHVVINPKDSFNLDLKVYINNQVVSNIIKVNSTFGVTDELMLGQFSPEKDIPTAFKGSDVYVDNVAIWIRVLNKTEQQKVYLAELGTIQIISNCVNAEKQFQISWFPPVDRYLQVKHFIVKYWKNGTDQNESMEIQQPSEIFNARASPSTDMMVLPESYAIDTLYNIEVKSITKDGSVERSETIQCNPNDAKKGDLVNVTTPTPFSLTFYWPKEAAVASFNISLSCQGPYQTKRLTVNKYIEPTSEDLNKTVENLEPSSTCKVVVIKSYVYFTKDVMSIGEVQYTYKNTVQTKSLVESVKYSVIGVEVIERTFDTLKLDITFNPEFIEYQMQYIFSYKSINDSMLAQSLKSIIPAGYSTFTLSITSLKEDTVNEIDIEVRDLGMLTEGPKLKTPLYAKTLDQFPPPLEIKLIESSPTSLLFSFKLDPDLQVSKHNIKYINFEVKDRYKNKSRKLSKSIEENNAFVSFKNLTQVTMYDVYASTGDGEKSGKMKHLLAVETNDQNECLTKDICNHPSRECVNLKGSYRCICKNNYREFQGHCIALATATTTPSTTKSTTTPTTNMGLTCPHEVLRNIKWPSTQPGILVQLPCPDGTTGNTTRKCMITNEGESPIWESPDLSDCESVAWLVIEKSDISPSTIIAINNFVETQHVIYGGDVANIVNTLEGIKVSKEDLFDGNGATNILQSVANVTSNLLEEKVISAWNDIPKVERSAKASLLLETAESMIEVTAQSSNQTIKVIKAQNLVMTLQKVSSEKRHVGDIELPEEVLGLEAVTLAVVHYNGIGDLLGVPTESHLQKKSKNLTLNSKVTSVSIFPLQKKTFTNPVVIVLQMLQQTYNDSIPNCVYWQKSVENQLNGGGYWSDNGCQVNTWNKSHVTCHCYHLTNFAVLMSVTDASEKQQGIHKLILSLITVLGISISLIALIAAFFTFVFIKKIKSLRNTIHQHLCLALFTAELIFLFGIEQTQHRLGCQVIAASLHYFFLASFFIMGLEGIVLYLMLVRVYKSRNSNEYGSFKYIIICWILPFLFITINLCLNDDAYGTNREFCWLSLKDKFIWSFVGPVILVITFNFIIFIMTLKIMLSKAKNRNSMAQEIWFWSKGCGLLLCILGLAWVIGIFYVDNNTVVFAYAFNIVNSLQGVSIFVFHCLCDPRVRKEYYNFFCCIRRKEALIYRTNSRTRSTSSGSKMSFLRKSTRKLRKDKSDTEKENIRLFNNDTPRGSASTRSSSTPDNSFGLLVGTNKY